MPPTPSSKPAARAPIWSAIDTVLLDMDGTLLDLKFDNRFWREVVPQRFATVNGLTLEQAQAHVNPMLLAKRGTLDWYCLDYWSRALNLDLAALKREVKDEVSWIPGAEAFVKWLRERGKRVALVTNAHPETLAVKNEQLDFTGHFDALYSSHPFSAPKESPEFWPRFHQTEKFEAGRTLFVDDNLSVLKAAREYGIQWICAIAHPDSTRPRNNTEDFFAVDAIKELMTD